MKTLHVQQDSWCVINQRPVSGCRSSFGIGGRVPSSMAINRVRYRDRAKSRELDEGHTRVSLSSTRPIRLNSEPFNELILRLDEGFTHGRFL